MKINLKGSYLEVRFQYDPDVVAGVKAIAGRRWHPDGKYWTVPADSVSARALLQMGFDDECLQVLIAEAEKKIEASSASSASVDIPVPDGLAYRPFQLAGIKYFQSAGSALIADEMGLGKTIQAIGAINADAGIKSVLVICPASLKINWKRECEKWLVRKLSIAIMDSKNGMVDTDIVICNYDIVSKFQESLSKDWDLLVLDESHYVKNGRAKRSKAVVKIAKGAKRKLLLTGTPLLNRPSELVNQLCILDKIETFGGWWGYMKRYCNGYKSRYGWDFSGAAHLEELQEKLRATCMVRRLKQDVLKELPEKVRQVIELPQNGCTRLVKRERNLYEKNKSDIERLKAELKEAKELGEDAYKKAIENLRNASRVAFTEMAQVRHEIALAKVEKVIEHILASIESGKVVVFAHHQDVIEAIKAGLEKESVGVVSLVGGDSLEDRQEAVDSFQNDSKVKVFVGSLHAASMGLTLTASSHVVFAELDWTPAIMTQAEDRCHRIGQEESVLIQHLVIDGSIDAYMAKQLLQKQEILSSALEAEEMIVPEI